MQQLETAAVGQVTDAHAEDRPRTIRRWYAISQKDEGLFTQKNLRTPPQRNPNDPMIFFEDFKFKFF